MNNPVEHFAADGDGKPIHNVSGNHGNRGRYDRHRGYSHSYPSYRNFSLSSWYPGSYYGGYLNGYPNWWYWLRTYPSYYYYNSPYYYYYEPIIADVVYTNVRPNRTIMPSELENTTPQTTGSSTTSQASATVAQSYNNDSLQNNMVLKIIAVLLLIILMFLILKDQKIY